MVCLMDVQGEAAGGILKRRRRVGAYQITKTHIQGVGILQAHLKTYDGISRRRLLRRAGWLRQELSVRGGLQLMLADGFPVPELFAEFPAPSSLSLYTAATGAVGEAAARERQGVTAAFFARGLGVWEEQALLRLAACFRYLIVVTDRDCDVICRNLRQRFGISVISFPTAAQTRMADFAVFLNEPTEPVRLSGECLVYTPVLKLPACARGGRTITDVEFVLPQRVLEAVPAGFSPEPIVSEALRHGFFDPDTLRIGKIWLDN